MEAMEEVDEVLTGAALGREVEDHPVEEVLGKGPAKEGGNK